MQRGSSVGASARQIWNERTPNPIRTYVRKITGNFHHVKVKIGQANPASAYCAGSNRSSHETGPDSRAWISTRRFAPAPSPAAIVAPADDVAETSFIPA